MSNPYYQRMWEVKVVKKDKTVVVLSTSETEPKSLRVQFDIPHIGYEAWYYCDVVVWNLTAETEKMLVEESSRLIVNAGYRDGAYGQIMDAQVVQCLIDRENVTDFKMTLHCIDGDTLINENNVSFTQQAGYTQVEIAETLCNNADNKVPIGGISKNLGQSSAARGKVCFGTFADFARSLAQGNKAQWFIQDGQIYMTKVSDPPTTEQIIVSPKTGLVGTPQQIEYGARFKTLLNPNIKLQNPAQVVKLDQAYIRQLKMYRGMERFATLDQDGIYKVIGVRHTGDTRGQDWYTEVDGISSAGRMPELLKTEGSDPG